MEPSATTQSHILALPTEILCLIFWLACRPTRSPLEHLEEKKLTDTEVQISHVCRYWRSTSLNYSRLWATIAYDKNHVKISDEKVLSHFKTYLRRAAGHLLDARFAFLEFYREDIGQNMLELLLENSSTCHRIFIYAPIDLCRSEFLTRFQEIRAPHLASYEVMFFDRSRGGPLRPRQSNPTCSLLGTPKLTHLSFQPMAFVSSIPCSPHITTIHIEGKFLRYTWTTLLTLLRLPCLRSLSIIYGVFLPPTDEQGVLERIVAPELVQFRCFSEPVVTRILHLLQAPKLDVLVLKGGDMPCFPSSQSLTHTLSLRDELEAFPVIFPSLRTLVLLDFTCEPSDSEAELKPRVLRFLAHATRSITNLYISDFMANLLRSIVKVDGDGSQIWPNLELFAVDTHLDCGRYLPPQFKVFLARRSGALPPSFKLAISRSTAAAWRVQDAISWSAIVESGYYHQSSPRKLISDISLSFNADGIFCETHCPFSPIMIGEEEDISRYLLE